ncbi:MAG: outer membrane beta-barrel family protein [Sediminibacterium sp.]
MNKIVAMLAAWLIFFSFAGQAQNNLNGKVAGNVLFGQKNIESASVGLLKEKDSSLVKLAVTDQAGTFRLDKIMAGKYLVVVQAMGYAKYYSETFQLAAGHADHTIHPASLQRVTKDLQGVTVIAKKAFIEQKIDRTIINVDASPSNTGATVLEVLEKSPGISVDKDGNISLKGKQGVMIMMDGKPTYLSSQDLASLLKSMPGSHLDQIEIMTNPPAKFDASGNSGVINIKTKKNKTMGYNGSVSLGYGQGIYPKTDVSTNLNYRNGKFNFFGNASHNYSENFGLLSIMRNFRDINSGSFLTKFDQLADMSRKYNSYGYKTGFDYFMNKKTTLGIVVNGFINGGYEFTDNTTLIKDKDGNLTTRTHTTNDVKADFKNTGLNLNLRHVFDSTGRELTSDVDYINYTSGNNQYLTSHFYDNVGNKKGADELMRGVLPSGIDIFSAKVDYTQPMKSKAKLETGVKSSYVTTDNDAQYANSDGSQYVTNTGRSNHFLYKENINAAYVSISKEFSKKWSGLLGLRAENTNMKGSQLTTGQVFTRNYTQLFPTIYISYAMNDKNQFSLNYGRRIDRPNYQDLNPFYYFLDKYTYQVGNPYLNPQFSHNIELNHTYNGFLTTSLNYSTTNDLIQEVLEQIDSTNTTFVKKSNIARRQNLGASISLGASVTKWWRANIYLNAYHNVFTGVVNGGPIEVAGTTFMTNISNQFTFNKGWGAELSGFYRSTGVEGVLVARPMGTLNIAFTKQVLKNKGSLKLVVRDFLYIQQFSGYSKYQNVDVTIHQSRDSRVVNLSFNYRFGKGKTAAQRKRGGAGEEQNRVNTGGNN